jgi:crotonobetainyl-CoA:carnitine CoA-transferase CaiB-like acyl-CoA transferase
MLLADMGARVIKVEQPPRGDDTRGWGPPFVQGESAYFLSINRNKQSLTLDLKQPGALRILEAILDRADVLVENFRPGTMERLGLGYEQITASRPRLIYCSISGFGQTGPRHQEPGYDAVVQAEGGLMSITGPADGPPYRLGVAISDIVAGMFAAHGITLALYAREKTGRGQRVDIGMLDTTAALLTYQAAIYFATGVPPGRLGNRHPTIVPYETFESSDGDFVVAVGNDEQWKRFCEVLDLTSLGQNPMFATNRSRVEHYDVIRPVLAHTLATRTRAEWVTRLKGAGVPCGAVRDIGEVLQDAQLDARGMVATVEHSRVGALRLLGVPIKLSGTPGAVETAPPTLGQHTRPILQDELGMSAEEMDELARTGAI